MKRLYYSLLICIFPFLVFVDAHWLPATCIGNGDNSNVSARDFLVRCGAGTIWIAPNTDGKVGIRKQVQSIAETALAIGALLAVALLVWSGIQYTITYGEDEKIKHAKTTAIYALIGLILMMASFWLVDVFLSFIFSVGSWWG